MGTRRLTKDIGATGIDGVRWGYLKDDYLREWNMPQKALTIDEMIRNTSVIGALRFAIEMSMRGVDWWFESDNEEDGRVEFAQEALNNLSGSWADHVSDSILAVFYGWSMFTITYEMVNGRALWRKFKPLKHTTLMRWSFDEDGSLAGMYQWPTDWPEQIPIERMVVYKIRSNYGNPEGESILRPAYPDYYYARNFKSLEGIAFERNGAGYPTIMLPEGVDTSDESDTSDIGKATRLVRNIRLDEQAGLVLPFGWSFEFKTPGQIPDFSDVINRYEKRMLMAALAQFLMLGQDRVGSQSLSVDQTDLFRLAVNTLCDIIAETFTQYPLKRLMRYNGLEEAGIKLAHSPAGDVDITTISDFLQKTGSLVSWTARDEVWLRSIAGMPDRSVEEIEADKMADDERKAEALARLQQAQAQQPAAQGGNGRDQMGVTVYNVAPDDRDRQRFEGAWQKKWEAWFDGQLDRIVEGMND